jgi:sec-independent protein translocase protein TatA
VAETGKILGARRRRAGEPRSKETEMGGQFSIWHILLVVAVGLLLFGGRGQISNLMGDAAKGIKAFKDGLKDEEEDKKAKKAEEEPKA